MPRTTYKQALSMEVPRLSTSAPPTKLGEQPLPPLADTSLQETKLLHNFLTLHTDFTLIYCLFYLGKLTEKFIMLLCIRSIIALAKNNRSICK